MKTFFLILASISVQLIAVQKEEVERLKLEVSTNLSSLQGWCSVEKALNFIDLVVEAQPETWVELGAFGGKSVYPVASAMKLVDKGVVIAVDPWDRFECIKYYDPVKDEANLRWWGKLNIDFIYNSYLSMLQRYQLEAFVETMRKTSEEAGKEIEEIDVIHMDGNHSEFMSLKDVQVYLPKVRSGGYIWMNDALWQERREAVDLLLEYCDVIKVIEGANCLLFKKR